MILTLNLGLAKNFVTQETNVTDEDLINGNVLILTEQNRFLYIALFLVVVVSSLALARLSRNEKEQFLRYIVYAACSLVSCIILLTQDNVMETYLYACIFYIIAVAISRILAIIFRRSKLSILLLVLLLLTAFVYSFLPAVFIVITLIFMDFQAIFRVMPIAFSRIRLDILKKIIRRTYALEILSGIALLIVAFSLLLPAFEENIPSFTDGLWYCFAIVTTIGFGDIYATSAIGRIMSVILGIYGIIVVALITSIIVNFYGELRKEDEGEDNNKEKSVDKETDAEE